MPVINILTIIAIDGKEIYLNWFLSAQPFIKWM